PDSLRNLAASTGGSYHQASSTKQLAGIYTWIGNVLSHTWELRYPTSERPGDSFTLSASIPRVGSATAPVKLAGLGGESSTTPPPALAPGAVGAPLMMPLPAALTGALLLLRACAFVLPARPGLGVRARLEPHLGQPKRALGKAQRKRERRPLRQQLVA